MKYLIILFLFFSFNTRAASYPPSDLSLGLMLGSITSMTGKLWLDKRSAFDFGLGFTGSSDTAVYGDYLWHAPGVFGTGTRFGRDSTGYIGGGAGIGFWRDSYDCGRWGCSRRTDKSGTGIFLRGLVGFEWYPQTTRFGVFAEMGPTLLITPGSGSGLDIGVGGRYYF